MLTTQWGSNTWSNPFLRFMMMAEVTERSRRHRDANSRPQLCFLCFLDDVCYLIQLEAISKCLVDGIDDSPKNDVIIYFSAAPWRWQVTWGSAAASDINLQMCRSQFSSYLACFYDDDDGRAVMGTTAAPVVMGTLEESLWSCWLCTYHGTCPRSPATSRIS